MMNIEELKEIWKDSNSKKIRLEINKELLREVSFNTLKNNLREIKWSSFFEIIINYIWISFLIDFLISNHSFYNFLLPALILLLIAVYSVAIETYKLVLYYTINNNLSILETQKKLERLRSLEIIDTNSLYIFIPIFFIPFLIVFFKGVLGVSIYDYGLSEREILFGTAGSFAVSIIVIYFLKKYPNKELRKSIDFINELKAMDADKYNESDRL